MNTFLTMAILFVFMTNTAFAQHESGLDNRPNNMGCAIPDKPPQISIVDVEQVFMNVPLDRPISLKQPPSSNNEWFLANRTGVITYFTATDPQGENVVTALDLSDKLIYTEPRLDYSQQWGITSITFNPDFLNNGYMYVGMNIRQSDTLPVESLVFRYTIDNATHKFDRSSEVLIISIEQNNPWHHLGDLAFGPDNNLYISMGDPFLGNASTGQDLMSLRAKILRLDVAGGFPYAIPTSNPFSDGIGGREEIFAWGLRNPWRFSFDIQTGELWVGDVGKSSWEEINLIEVGNNYGWEIAEGKHCVVAGCDLSGITMPIHEYSHDEGAAVIMGYVYRGSKIPELDGVLLFGDFSHSLLWGLYPIGNNNYERRTLIDMPIRPSSFAQGNDGEVYAMNWTGSEGAIYKVIPATPSQTPVVNLFPSKLSETGCFEALDPRYANNSMLPYRINAERWSDNAVSQRWVALPDGETIVVNPDGDFVFPTGTVLAKSFLLHDKFVETRLLVRHDSGQWAGYSYEWLDDQSDAILLDGGKIKTLSEGENWTFPSRLQCLQCHNSVAQYALGTELIQLNGMNFYGKTGRTANQLSTLNNIGMFSTALPSSVDSIFALSSVDDKHKSLHHRARSYLHSNCSGCHRPNGPAQANMDFRFSMDDSDIGACTEIPQHDSLGVLNPFIISPGDPSSSILSLRMHNLDSARMPPLGTVVVDENGAALIDSWITSDSACALFNDVDQDGISDTDDNCINEANPNQLDSNRDGIGDLCDPGASSFLSGIPAYVRGIGAAEDTGVLVWKKWFDGPYHVRINENDGPFSYQLKIISSDDFVDVKPYSIEGQDVLNISSNGLSLYSELSAWEDGVDITVPTDATLWMSIIKQNSSMQIPVRIGAGKKVMQPVGWLFDLDKLPPLPSFSAGKDPGLFLGVTAAGSISATWNGVGKLHPGIKLRDKLVITGTDLSGPTTLLNMEAQDIVTFEGSSVLVNSLVGDWWDSIELQTTASSMITVEFLQDSVFNTALLNSLSPGSKHPNSYRLPKPNILGSPSYNPGLQSGLRIWKESESVWRLEASAGGDGKTNYRGRFISSMPPINFAGKRLEQSDSIIYDASNGLEFDFTVFNKWTDGMTVEYPAGTIVQFEVLVPNSVATQTYIGPDEWPVKNFPVVLQSR